MITIITHGNIFDSDTDALVNPVNCVGVMGKGLALQFKNLYPEYFRAYYSACNMGIIRPGAVHIYCNKSPFNPMYIISFPTKNHWRELSRIEYIITGLKSLANEIHKYNIKSISIPRIGCGLGGLNWNDVYPLIEETFALCSVQVLVFA